MSSHIFLERRECYIVAEMSGNHGGSLARALEIIAAAKEVGADAVKLQTYTPDTLTLNSTQDDFRIPPGTPWSDRKTLYELYKLAYTPWEWHAELFAHAKKIGIEIFSTPFDFTAVDLLESLGNPIYKVASPEITDIPLIEYIAAKGKPVIFSAGMAGQEDLELALSVVKRTGNRDIVLCQCTSAYPAPFSELNLAAIGRIRELFDVVPGLSDHSVGTMAPVIAVTLGAKFIEKHFTIDKSLESEDSFFSLDFAEFKKLVTDIRQAESALGNSDFALSGAKKKNRRDCRSLYVAAPIKKGEKFTAENVRSVRPGFSLHPKHYKELLGKTAKRAYDFGSRIDEAELHYQ